MRIHTLCPGRNKPLAERALQHIFHLERERGGACSSSRMSRQATLLSPGLRRGKGSPALYAAYSRTSTMRQSCGVLSTAKTPGGARGLWPMEPRRAQGGLRHSQYSYSLLLRGFLKMLLIKIFNKCAKLEALLIILLIEKNKRYPR